MMKKILKIIIIFILAFLLVFIGKENVLAVGETCDVEITEVDNKTEIKKGETATYEIKAKNINAGTGIIMLTLKTEYDSSSFECEVNPIENGQWSKTSFLENTLIMTRTDLLPSNQDQAIAKISFTAKSDATLGIKEFKFSDIKFNTEEGTFEVEGQSKSIKLIETTPSTEEPEKPTTTNETENDVNNETSNEYDYNTNTNNNTYFTNELKNSINNEVQDNSQNENNNVESFNINDNSYVNSSYNNSSNNKSGSKLPYTGIGNGVLAITLLGIAISAVASYSKYRNLKNL